LVVFAVVLVALVRCSSHTIQFRVLGFATNESIGRLRVEVAVLADRKELAREHSIAVTGVAPPVVEPLTATDCQLLSPDVGPAVVKVLIKPGDLDTGEVLVRVNSDGRTDPVAVFLRGLVGIALSLVKRPSGLDIFALVFWRGFQWLV